MRTRGIFGGQHGTPGVYFGANAAVHGWRLCAAASARGAVLPHRVERELLLMPKDFTPAMSSQFISAVARNMSVKDAVKAWRIASMDRPKRNVSFRALAILVGRAVEG